MIKFATHRDSKPIQNKTSVTYDPLGQTHSLASNFVTLLDFEKWRMYERTDMCENNDPYRPWLWVGRVDQYL